MTRSFSLPAISALFLAVLVAVLASAGWRIGNQGGQWPPLLACGAAALLYAAAHLMRAIRLAVIAMPFLCISFRSVVALHLFVAPWSLVLPFKLDELIRLNELWRVSGSLARSVATILIDRSMDGIILIALALYLRSTGRTEVAGFVGFVGVGLTLIALGFIILPLLLETVQRHIFIYNHGPNALYVLKKVSATRQLLAVSRQTIGGAAPFLLLTTLGIWTMELLALWVVLTWDGDTVASIPASVEMMLKRADDSWRLLLAPASGSPLMTRATLLFYGSMLVLWCPAALIYTARQKLEPRRPRLPARTGFSSLANTKGI